MSDDKMRAEFEEDFPPPLSIKFDGQKRQYIPAEFAGPREYENRLAREHNLMFEAWQAACDSQQTGDEWKQAIDAELVVSLQCTADSYETPWRAISDLIHWNVKVATDPKVNGGYELVKQAGEPVAEVRATGGLEGHEWVNVDWLKPDAVKRGDKLYTTPQPQTAAPEAITLDQVLRAREEDVASDEFCKGAVEGWNFCREAMLKVAPEPPQAQPDWTPRKDAWDESDAAVKKYLDEGGDDPVAITQIVWKALKYKRPEPPEDAT